MTKMRNLKAVGHRVLVRLKQIDESLEEMSDGGIITKVKTKSRVDLEKQATQEAYVIQIGQNAWKAYDDGDPWAKVGDCVLISKYSGDDRHDIEDGEIYRLINDGDIHGVFEGEELSNE